MSFLPSVHEYEQPFNDWMRRIAFALVLIFVPCVVLAQQFLVGLGGQTLTKPLAEVAASEETPEPGISQLAISSKVLMKSLFFEEHYNAREGIDPLEELGDPDAPPTITNTPHSDAKPDAKPNAKPAPRPVHLGIHGDPEVINESIAELESIAITRTDRVRLAIVLAEARGPQAAVDRLRELRKELEPGTTMHDETYWLIEHYSSWAKGVPATIAPDVKNSLASRHGWFGELAATFGADKSERARWNSLAGFSSLLRMQYIYGIIQFLSFVAGVVVLIGLILRFVRDGVQSNIEYSTTPGYVYFEAFALFMLGFVIMDFASVLMLGSTSVFSFVTGEITIWTVSLAALWPLLRGVHWSDFREDIGLYRGEGIATEIVWGLLAYLTELPILFLAGYIIQVASGTSDESGPSGVPMFDQPLTNSWAAVVMSTISSVIWAPLVEELLFRGCLHKAMPRWLGVAGRVLVSAAIFGAIHPYSPSGLIMVGIGGVFFGLLREWRGSLISCMVTHALHNGTIAAFTVITVASIE